MPGIRKIYPTIKNVTEGKHGVQNKGNHFKKPHLIKLKARERISQEW